MNGKHVNKRSVNERSVTDVSGNRTSTTQDITVIDKHTSSLKGLDTEAHGGQGTSITGEGNEGGLPKHTRKKEKRYNLHFVLKY